MSMYSYWTDVSKFSIAKWKAGGAAEADTLPPRAKVTEAAHIRRVAILLGR